MIILDITTFLGRLHPLIVHLPIGFLLLAILFNFLAYLPKYANLKTAVPLTLLVGFIAAVLACIFGYILSFSGEYNLKLLKSHKVSGISVAMVSGILYLLSTDRFMHYITPKIYSAALVLLFILVSFSGHQGGTLTHGNEYLTMKVLFQQERLKPTSVNEAYIFEDVVMPILEDKCSQCHQGSKLKGNLSIETLADLKKGGKHGAAIVAGKLAESELYKRITLNPDSKEFMPTDGKTPLTKNETEIIKWWIEHAQAVENKRLVDLKNTQEIIPQVSAFLGLGDASTSVGNNAGQTINADIPLTIDGTQLESLKKKGFVIRVMLQKPMMLDVTLPAQSSTKLNTCQTEFKTLAKNIIWLNLSANNLNDDDLAFLQNLTNLEKLRVEKNPLTDEVCKHLTGLKHLEAVNLNETHITEKGIKELAKNPAIKRVYSWQTGVKSL
ncbi:c-type cytochrome domain-containing protein [Emticicia soli]|uniref:C-type cytochrome domain-containing protein n=1 Tax=Emticicia soli TaxID=2027878 RepID=A0ABW5J5X4_9BACT